MTHDELVSLLAAFADGELEAGRRMLMEEHVRRCAECARRLEELRRLSRALRLWEVPGATAERARALSSTLVQMLPHRPAASCFRRPSWIAWAFPAGLVIWGALVEAAAVLTMAFGLAVMAAGLFAPADAWLSWLAGLFPSLNAPAWLDAVRKVGDLGCQALGINRLLPASFWGWLMSFLMPTIVFVSLLTVVCLGVWGWFGVQTARRQL
ncbi:MAG: anti-sigma factor family protein [Anaerolineae bacterium]